MIEQNKQWKEGDFEKHWHIDPDKFAEKVVEQLLKSNTSLWGDSKFLGKTDPDVTIQQRIDRGSYLSGELSGQIKHQFDRIVRGTIDKTSGNMVNLDEKVAQQRAQARMRGQNLEVYGGVNDDSVSRFFNRELKNEGILPSLVNTGAKVIDDIKGTLDRLMGNESKTAFERSLSQIREQGCKDYPSTDTKFWDTFQDYWSERVNAPKDSPMGKEFAFIEGKMRLFARDQARNGKIVDEKMLTEQLGKLLTHPFMTSRVQEMRNHNYISQCTPQDIANAIRLWRDQQPLEVQQKISQNDCDWLANQLEKSMESERLLMERAPSLGTGFKDWVSDFTSFGEKYDKFGSSPVLSRIYDTIAKNYEQMQVPGLMSDKQRFEFYKEKYGEKSLESVQEFFRPKAWGPDTLSKLVGDSINEVLLDRHDRIEQMMPELQKNRESREILQDNLTLFPSLKTQSNVFFEHPEVLKLNPTKPSQFINAIVHDPLVYAKTVDEMQRQIKTGAWKSTLPPEPKPPQEGAPKSEVDKYQEDKREYEKLVGEEHGRYMKEVVKQRDMMHELVDMNSGYFNVLDEVEEAVKEPAEGRPVEAQRRGDAGARTQDRRPARQVELHVLLRLPGNERQPRPHAAHRQGGDECARRGDVGVVRRRRHPERLGVQGRPRAARDVGDAARHAAAGRPQPDAARERHEAAAGAGEIAEGARIGRSQGDGRRVGRAEASAAVGLPDCPAGLSGPRARRAAGAEAARADHQGGARRGRARPHARAEGPQGPRGRGLEGPGRQASAAAARPRAGEGRAAVLHLPAVGLDRHAAAAQAEEHQPVRRRMRERPSFRSLDGYLSLVFSTFG
jgi:hypothetical protein